MADVIHRQSGEMRLSVHTPDYSARDWLPLSAGERDRVLAVPQNRRVVTGDTVRAMTAAEAAAADLAELPARKAARRQKLAEELAADLAEKRLQADPRLSALDVDLAAARTPAEVDAVTLRRQEAGR